MTEQDGEGGAAPARPWVTGLLAFAVTVAILFLAQVAGVFVAQYYASGALEPGLRVPGEMETEVAFRMGASILAFQLTAFTLTLLATPFLAVRIRRPVIPLCWPVGGFATLILASVALIAFATAAGGLVYRLDKAALEADLSPFMQMVRSRGWWVLLLAGGVGAPIVEELLMRGFLFSGLRAWLGFAGTALVTSLLWTALHVNYSAYGLTILFLIGLYLAWLRERTQSVWPCILSHGLYNGLILLVLASI